MAEDVSIQLNLSSISIDTQYWTLNHAIDWLANLQWWEWLILLKIGFVFWVLNVTVILPSIYMQVLLYTDEMTSRMMQPPLPTLRDISRMVHLAVAKYSPMQKTEEFLHCREETDAIQKVD